MPKRWASVQQCSTGCFMCRESEIRMIFGNLKSLIHSNFVHIYHSHSDSRGWHVVFHCPSAAYLGTVPICSVSPWHCDDCDDIVVTPKYTALWRCDGVAMALRWRCDGGTDGAPPNRDSTSTWGHLTASAGSPANLLVETLPDDVTKETTWSGRNDVFSFRFVSFCVSYDAVWRLRLCESLPSRFVLVTKICWVCHAGPCPLKPLHKPRPGCKCAFFLLGGSSSSEWRYGACKEAAGKQKDAWNMIKHVPRNPPGSPTLKQHIQTIWYTYHQRMNENTGYTQWFWL